MRVRTSIGLAAAGIATAATAIVCASQQQPAGLSGASTEVAATVEDYRAHRAALERQGGAQAGDVRVRRGRYIATISGCNDCHTAGYPESGGTIPEGEWLLGSDVGFLGPWGTSYPSNLRLTTQRLTEDQFVARARSPMLPPMPWFSLRDMTEDDVRAVYAYLRALGPSGVAAPAPLPPGALVTTPYIEFVPRKLPPQAMAR